MPFLGLLNLNAQNRKVILLPGRINIPILEEIKTKAGDLPVGVTVVAIRISYYLLKLVKILSLKLLNKI